MSIFGPRTVKTAMEGITAWDRAARSLPLLSEQMRGMKDRPQTWSLKPAIAWSDTRIGTSPRTRRVGYVTPVTEITELGREVRAALSTPHTPTGE